MFDIPIIPDIQDIFLGHGFVTFCIFRCGINQVPHKIRQTTDRRTKPGIEERLDFTEEETNVEDRIYTKINVIKF